eukprot:TRINITY_DN1305_c1_g3_i2.p1 TRINITY_DN1305_c1_g3~~TRINITY_DN1305_c1_g3_i2.p1  ORF type:complete len:797 (+),score=294.70 TRINITY_DN1305_c1_g3_i2:31-2391(+)
MSSTSSAATAPCGTTFASEGRPPRVPQPGQRNVLITSALPYVNNVPHLGNLIGAVLSADIYSRYCRLRGYNSVYICGTDEYGTATETKAIAEGVTPQQICDKYHAIHRDIYRWFGIDFDHFGRTTTPHQTRIAQDIFLRLHERNCLVKKTVDQPFCEHCKRFLADRYIIGTCPGCDSTSARGDQCDRCDKLLTPLELVDPRCKVCGKFDVVVKSSEHFFLDLPAIKDRLGAWLRKSTEEGEWSRNGVAIASAWVEGDLHERCITRDLKWGTPVPLEEYSDKVFYVWFDAPIGYISITANYTDEWEKWWKSPDNVELVQFMGKDNVPFHAVVFPASQIGADDGYTMVNHISTTEYLTYEGQKFSKTECVGVFGDKARDACIEPEIWRYYLSAIRPETSDTDFDWANFADRNNNELLKNLGNFVNRVLTFVNRHFEGAVAESTHELGESERTLIAEADKQMEVYHAAFKSKRLREALGAVMALSRAGNVYLQESQLWELVKKGGEEERCALVVRLAACLVALVALTVHPFMPQLTDKLGAQLNTTFEVYGTLEADFSEEWFRGLLPTPHRIGEVSPLFKNITPKQVEELRAKFGGKAVEAKKPKAKKGGGKKKGGNPTFVMDIRVGRVESAEAHESSDKLAVLRVDVGEEEARQVLAGVREYYSLEELRGRAVAVLVNLAPADLAGMQSCGMCLAAKFTPAGEPKDASVVRLVSPPADAAPGSLIRPQGAVDIANEAILTKKDISKVKLKVNTEHEVQFTFGSGKYTLAVDGCGPVLCPEAPSGSAVK